MLPTFGTEKAVLQQICCQPLVQKKLYLGKYAANLWYTLAVMGICISRYQIQFMTTHNVSHIRHIFWLLDFVPFRNQTGRLYCSAVTSWIPSSWPEGSEEPDGTHLNDPPLHCIVTKTDNVHETWNFANSFLLQSIRHIYTACVYWIGPIIGADLGSDRIWMHL